jgi:acetyltransferase-like isoleucine patch superfamily enzyme
MKKFTRHEAKIRDVTFGDDVTIVEPVNLYECIIGDGTFIGPFVEVQKGVQIGDRCKIQSHSFVCELVTIGDNCFVSHGAMFINDRFQGGGPAGGDESKWERTVIEDNVSIGTNATILPVRICSGTVVGAGAVVTSDIEEPGVYVGNPARRLRDLP